MEELKCLTVKGITTENGFIPEQIELEVVDDNDIGLIVDFNGKDTQLMQGDAVIIEKIPEVTRRKQKIYRDKQNYIVTFEYIYASDSGTETTYYVCAKDEKDAERIATDYLTRPHHYNVKNVQAVSTKY